MTKKGKENQRLKS